MGDHYDRQGNPLTLMEWAERKEGRMDNRVAEAILPTGYWVSTVWLGLDHSFGSGPPLIFETMVFPCDADGKVTDWSEVDADRYSTEAEAVMGHQAMVEKWSKEQPAETLADA